MGQPLLAQILDKSSEDETALKWLDHCRADARTRTGDPFITSKVTRPGGTWRGEAGIGLLAAFFRPHSRAGPLVVVGRFRSV